MALEWDALVTVGRIARTHGNRGQVIVNPETDFPDERFRAGAVVYIARDGRVEPVTLTAVRFHQGRPIVALDGVATMNEAETLAGLELRVPASELTPLPEATYYRHDLVGCVVETVAGEPVGTVTGVEGTLDLSRLVVQGRQGEVLIPLVATICVRVDPAPGRSWSTRPRGCST